MLCRPAALLVLLVWSIVWLLSIPFRILKMLGAGLLALLKGILLLPARMLAAGLGRIVSRRENGLYARITKKRTRAAKIPRNMLNLGLERNQFFISNPYSQAPRM
jgi:hypothetical protein